MDVRLTITSSVFGGTWQGAGLYRRPFCQTRRPSGWLSHGFAGRGEGHRPSKGDRPSV